MHSIGRRMSRPFISKKNTPSPFPDLSFAMKSGFSLWRVVAEVQVAPVFRKCLLSQPTWQTSGIWPPIPNYDEGFFLRGFDRDRVQTKTCTCKLDLVQHVLRMMAVKLRHACALASHVGMVTTVPRRRWTTQFSAFATRDLSQAEPLHNI